MPKSLKKQKVLEEAFEQNPARFKNRVPSAGSVPEAAWINKPENHVPQLWCGDFFTVYEEGEGPHSPVDSQEAAMPRWLWNEIEKIMTEKGRLYAIIRFTNYEA